MSIEQARRWLQLFGRDGDILEFEVSSATVSLAAQALGTEEGRIAKSIALKKADSTIILVTAGTVKIDNRKYKDQFGCKAVMLQAEEVLQRTGHEIGGVCPFGIPENVEVYLDQSLRQYDYVFPACGSANSGIKLSCAELEQLSRNPGWVDVCRERESNPIELK
ncbi:MAG: YbaK/EbsC family protein [Spirochaetes bacterium]|nr:YbaK/EbsC family protein [Spirochaetota bacterium]MBU0954395.1 YbaK/EbsC family protein [Spirochaetota bacterium]